MTRRFLYKKFRQNILLILVISSIYLLFLALKYLNPEHYSVNGIYQKLRYKRNVDKDVENFYANFADLNISYQFFIEKGFKCDDKKLVIVIPSRPNGFDNRMGIRSSWLKNLPSDVGYHFIIGSSDNQTIQESIDKEDQEFHDIIFTSLHESYSNLTLKTYSIFQWKENYCPKAKFLLKTDDDTVVDVKRMQYWINKSFNRISNIFNGKVIYCKVWTNTTPFRDPQHKWYIPESAFNGTVFPDFCSGPTYLVTSDAVPAILAEAPKHYFITTEDVFFTGILSHAAKVYRFPKEKNFGSGPEISNHTRCDRKGVPYLTSLYGISFNGTIYDEEENNPFKNSTDELLSLSCTGQNVITLVSF